MSDAAQNIENTGVDLGPMGPLVQKANEIHTEIATLKATIDEKGGESEARISELNAQLASVKDDMSKVHAERMAEQADAKKAEIDKDVERMLAEFKSGQNRKPSKAGYLGGAVSPEHVGEGSLANFHALVAKARDTHDLAGMQKAQAELAGMGSVKATLGETDANGAYLIPNNVVGPLIEQATAANIWRQELTVIRGVRGSAVEVPTEGLAPTGATVISWGSTKTNLSFTVASYTATLYTLAAIYDVSNQLLRQSEGAAEQLVRSRLARALALGEAKYILAGSGTSEPKGILTSIGTSGDFVSNFTPNATNLANSVASAIATAAGVIASRDRTPTAAVLSPASFWTMLAQGTDEAGFFFDPSNGPSGIDANVPNVRVFGVRVFPDSNMNVANGAADDLVVGDFKGAQLFIGDDYRVDTSTEANDRWDKNLTGFRAEEEIGFNADPYVASGYFQRILDVQP